MTQDPAGKAPCRSRAYLRNVRRAMYGDWTSGLSERVYCGRAASGDRKGLICRDIKLCASGKLEAKAYALYCVTWWRERKVAGWRYCKVVVETWAQNHD